MTFRIDRRTLVLGAGLGLGALALPGGGVLAEGLRGARGFTHCVASGEPAASSMLLWTRYVPATGDAVRLVAEIAADPAFTSVVGGGSVATGPWRDWTAKLTVAALRPGTTYYYRFIAPDGTMSPVGRTRTLPVGPVARFGLGLFSCSNLPVGHFNAYGHAAARADLDLWLHVGDYIYEAGRPGLDNAGVIAARVLAMEPAHEIVALTDYRMRIACYRADPDLQRLHQLAPMVAMWDDHESANNSWEGGADQHQPDSEGEWNTRKAAAMQAYREWMPISEEPWKTYTIGNLATLYRTESRLLGRTRQIDMGPALAAGDAAALAAFRDGPWQDDATTMLGSAQEVWLADALQSNARSTAWQLVGMGTIVGRTCAPADILDWLKPDASERRVSFWRDAVRAAREGLPMWMDRWDGYPAARARLLAAAQRADADLVMLAGDSHNAWAFQLAHDGSPAGVEFAGQAVSSNGIEGELAVDPAVSASGFVAANPEMHWAETSRRGYMMIELTPDQVTGEWQFLRTVKERDLTLAGTHRMSVERGRRVFTA